jgi:hypothetical protein
MKWGVCLACAAATAIAVLLSPYPLFSHGSVTTTVLFDREIVRILDNHCVMCHSDGGVSFPLETYEQTWLQGKTIRADVLARHMPPWGAVRGYGEFVNDNSLTLRETQFVVAWVEGLGPRNAGTVFTNVADASARPPAVRAQAHAGHWQLGEPDLVGRVPPNTIAARQPDEVRRTIIDPGLKEERSVRAVEFMPGDRRVVRAAFFTVQETGQWIGSWTPWHGVTELPEGSAYRLPAGSRIVAEIHYRGATEEAVDAGAIGLFFSKAGAPRRVDDLVLAANTTASKAGASRVRIERRLTADAYAMALRPEAGEGLKSIEVSTRNPDGGTEVLLFAQDPPADWPTPYIFAKPMLLRRGATLSVTAYYDTTAPPQGVKLTVSHY